MNLERNWRDAVFRIDSAAEDKRDFGTGFVCFRDATKTYLLTCNHVIEAIGEANARIEKQPIEVVKQGNDTLDLALIKVEGLPETPVLPLGFSGEQGRAFEIYGHSWADPKNRSSGTTIARLLKGSLGGDPAFYSRSGDKVPAWDLPFDKDDEFAELLEGYSGSPVWDPGNQQVIAVVSHRRGTKMGYAIAASNLLKIHPAAEGYFQSVSTELNDNGTDQAGEYVDKDEGVQMIAHRVQRGKLDEMKNASEDHVLSGSHERQQQFDTTRPVRLFISYSHIDEVQKEEVVICLKALPPDIHIEAWDDTRMRAGDRFNEEIFQEIDRTDVFLALISRYYLASDYCQKEMTSALKQAENRGCRVVPVIVRKTESWRDYPIGQHLALPPDGKAPSDWNHEDEHWAAIESGLKHLLREPGDKGELAADQTKRSPLHSSTINQERIETVDEQMFQASLKAELERDLSHEQLKTICKELVPALDQVSAAQAADALLCMEPLDSIREWTKKCAPWFRNLSPQEKKQAWKPVRDVHLRLLPRLIDPDWVERWKQNNDKAHDKRLLTVPIKHKAPNRPVEILMARLDPKCGGVRFDQETDSRREGTAPGQINVDHEALRFQQKPTADSMVQRLGLYLLAQYEPDKDPPKNMESDDWQDLNDHIVERPLGGLHYYYLVIPENAPDFADDDVLRALYEKMPNLPRVLLVGTGKASMPLIDRQGLLEAVISAFWDINKPSEQE